MQKGKQNKKQILQLTCQVGYDDDDDDDDDDANRVQDLKKKKQHQKTKEFLHYPISFGFFLFFYS